MGIWSAVSGLFTGSKAVDAVKTVTNAAIEGLDNWNFSDEEKAKYAKKMMGVWIEVQKATANENSLKSITRRFLAVGIIYVYLFIVLLACLVYKLDSEYSAFLLEVARSLNYLVFPVSVFYFGYYAWKNIIKAKKE
jgi:hypothetical protein